MADAPACQVWKMLRNLQTAFSYVIDYRRRGEFKIFLGRENDVQVFRVVTSTQSSLCPSVDGSHLGFNPRWLAFDS
jgi:hypothetical protein